MKTILDIIKKTFSFSKNEAKGTLVLFGILLTLWVSIRVSDIYFDDSSSEIKLITTESLDSLSIQKTTYFNKFKDYNRPNYDNKEPALKAENFNFNPNNATVNDLKRLGIPPKIALTIEKYRNKNGRFKYKEDLMKIYGFPINVYERLEGYIELPSKENNSIETPQAVYSGSYEKSEIKNENELPPSPSTTIYKSKPKNIAVFDLNTADTTQLMQVRGIGKVTAEKIIKFRESLGGFYDKNQVRATYNLPPETADELLKYTTIGSSVRKIAINKIALKDFRFGALSYNQRKAIINYREQHGVFKSTDDLKQIRILNEEAISNFAPYIEF